MRRKNKFIFKLIAASLSLLFFCEYLVYHIVISQCSWPSLKDKEADKTVQVDGNEDAVKALLIADIHLLGRADDHWFDKLRREWQMHVAFQTSMSLFKPEVVFVLGDLFDKGMHCSNSEFEYFVRKLKSLFAVEEGVKVFYIPGNHDIGYHYDITMHLHKRFVVGLKAPPVQLVTIKGNHFVLMNSMAMEGDGCFICRPAQVELTKIAKRLKCAKGVGKCPRTVSMTQYSRPILLQHYPMYRESDSVCVEADGAPEEEKHLEFHEGWDCLSREASDMIYDALEPRVIFGGHTHHGCHVVHRKDIHEYTLSSFNWRNKNNPSFIMGVFLPNNFAVSKCSIPQETTVVFFYCVGIFIILLWVILSFKLSRPYRKFHWRLDFVSISMCDLVRD